MPDRLSRQVTIVKKHRISCMRTMIISIVKKGFTIPQIKPFFQALIYVFLFLCGPFGAFIPRSLIEAVSQEEGFSTDAFEYDLMLKASLKADSIERIDKVLYHVQDAACISAEAEKIEARREEEAFRLGRKSFSSFLAAKAH